MLNPHMRQGEAMLVLVLVLVLVHDWDPSAHWISGPRTGDLLCTRNAFVLVLVRLMCKYQKRLEPLKRASMDERMHN